MCTCTATSQTQELTICPQMLQELDSYIDELGIQRNDPRKKEFLIQSLHKAQAIFGYLPEDIQKHIAKRLTIKPVEVSRVISFYNYFATEPKGKYKINVCMGTACYVKGADKVLEEFEKVLGIKSGEATEDLNFSLETLRCVGACGLAPVVMVNDQVFGKVDPVNVKKILQPFMAEETETEKVAEKEAN